MPREVKADIFAGEGSFAGKLKKRRKQMEEMEMENGSNMMQEVEEPQPTTDDRRGYTKEKWDNGY